MSIISTGSFLIWLGVQSVRSLNRIPLGTQKYLGLYVGPVALAIGATACIVACIMVSVGWIQMATAWPWISPKQLAMSRMVIMITAFLYFCTACLWSALFASSYSHYSSRFFGGLNATIFLANSFAFRLGASLVSRSLSSVASKPTDSLPAAKAEEDAPNQVVARFRDNPQTKNKEKKAGSCANPTKITHKKQKECAKIVIECARYISVCNFFCSCGMAAYVFSCSNPAHGKVVHSSTFIVVLNIFCMQVKLCDYLASTKALLRRHRKIAHAIE